MEYRKTITLKDGRICILRNGTVEDGKAVLDNFILTHEQTDNLLSYPDESDIRNQCRSGILGTWDRSGPSGSLYRMREKGRI